MGEYLNKEVFEQDVRGFLFFVEPTVLGTDKYKLVFEFNKETLIKLREGDIVAVEAFPTTSGSESGVFYTLLEITRMSPTHITIDRLKRYRFMGAVREFLKEATKDFEEEDPRLIRDHVYVEGEAVATNYLMKVSGSNVDFKMESSKPILGRDVGVLKPKIVEMLINYGIKDGLVLGNLYSNYEERGKVKVKVRPHRMVTHHYSIFGFTGSGKSNLSSTLITKLVKEEKLNTLVFDLSDEYTALLIDLLEESGVIVIDREDAPDSLVEYFAGKNHDIDTLAKELSEKTKKPGIFDSEEFVEPYQKVFKKLIQDGRIKLIDTTTIGVTKGIDFNYFMKVLYERCSPNASNRTRCEQLTPFIKKFVIEDDTIEKDQKLNFPIDSEDILEKIKSIIFDKCYPRLSWQSEGQYAPAITGIINSLIEEIKLALETETAEVNENYVSDEWILENYIYKEKKGRKLCIIVSSERESMSNLINILIDRALRARRKKGTKTHDVLFVVDEAHEFVVNPRESGISPEERECSRKIEKLSRMGRKYGLGICISSQRVAHLNTSAISNCHTTFIGALPRKYDRDSMHEAYAVSPEVLDQVVTFPPGNWYVVSSGAMGINNVPIRIISPNREKELAKFFMNRKYLTQKGTEILKKEGYLP